MTKLTELGKGDKDENKQETGFESTGLELTKDEPGEVVTEGTTNEFEALLNKIKQEPKGKKKVQRSIYLDEDVCKAFDKFGHKNPRKKSDLINSFLRMTFGLPEDK